VRANYLVDAASSVRSMVVRSGLLGVIFMRCPTQSRGGGSPDNACGASVNTGAELAGKVGVAVQELKQAGID
jgi:hypothetical protein